MQNCQLNHSSISAWNFGPLAEDNKQVEELVQAALLIWGSGAYKKPKPSIQPHEAGLLKLEKKSMYNSKLDTQIQFFYCLKKNDYVV